MILELTGIDVEVYQWVTQRRGEPWITGAQVVTVFANTIPLTLLTIAVVGGLLLRRHYSTATLVGVGALSGYALMVGLKALFGRDRPPVADRLVDIGTHSFPSGHAMLSAICYGLFAVAAFHLSDWVRDHRWILAAVPALSLIIGCSRIYLGVHWLTDVLAGWTLGALWVALCVLVWRRWRSTATPDSSEPAVSSPDR